MTVVIPTLLVFSSRSACRKIRATARRMSPISSTTAGLLAIAKDGKQHFTTEHLSTNRRHKGSNLTKQIASPNLAANHAAFVLRFVSLVCGRGLGLGGRRGNRRPIAPQRGERERAVRFTSVDAKPQSWTGVVASSGGVLGTAVPVPVDDDAADDEIVAS
jgi:hypothetical protein